MVYHMQMLPIILKATLLKYLLFKVENFFRKEVPSKVMIHRAFLTNH